MDYISYDLDCDSGVIGCRGGYRILERGGGGPVNC